MTDQELLYVYIQKGAPQSRRDQLEEYRKRVKPNTAKDQDYWDFAYYTVENQSKNEESRIDYQNAKQWWLSLNEQQRQQMEQFVRGGGNTVKIVKTDVRTGGWQAQVGGWTAILSIVLVVYFVYLKRPGRWL